MPKRVALVYNPFFFIPFFLWGITGALLLAFFSRHQLFYAINGHYSDAADNLMYYLTWLGQGEVIAPVLLLLIVIPRLRNWHYVVTALCCNLIPFFIQQGLKTLFDHPRPRLLYYYEIDKMHALPGWQVLLQRSFPSGHSQGAFSFFCFLSLLLPPRYNKLGILFFLLAFAVAYSRVYLAAHFFDDIYAGSLLGVVLTTAIYSIMDKYKGPVNV